MQPADQPTRQGRIQVILSCPYHKVVPFYLTLPYISRTVSEEPRFSSIPTSSLTLSLLQSHQSHHAKESRQQQSINLFLTPQPASTHLYAITSHPNPPTSQSAMATNNTSSTMRSERSDSTSSSSSAGSGGSSPSFSRRVRGCNSLYLSPFTLLLKVANLKFHMVPPNNTVVRQPDLHNLNRHQAASSKVSRPRSARTTPPPSPGARACRTSDPSRASLARCGTSS